MGGAPANSLCVCFWLFAWCGGGCKVASPIGGLNAQSAAAHGGGRWAGKKHVVWPTSETR